MPHFYFDLVEDGNLLRDETGVALDSIGAAKLEARKALADLVREEIREASGDRARGRVAIHIREHTAGPVVLAVSYSVSDSEE